MIVGLAGFGVTISEIEFVVIVTGATQFAFDVSLQVIISPFTGVEIVMAPDPLVPGMETPFLNQLITGEEPGFVFVKVNVADSPEHKEVFGVEIEAV